MPRCASNALSTFRTVCFGLTSALVRRCTSLTAPLSLATIRAANTPGSVTNNSSARRRGRTLPAIGDTGDDGLGALSGTDTSTGLGERGRKCGGYERGLTLSPSLRPGGEVTACFSSRMWWDNIPTTLAKCKRELRYGYSGRLYSFNFR